MRVWVNDNYALNKIGADVYSEREMIEQLLFVVSNRVNEGEKDKFMHNGHNLLKFNKLSAAKNNISGMLHQVHRKHILQELITK